MLHRKIISLCLFIFLLMCNSNCGNQELDIIPHITVKQLFQKEQASEKFYLLDVRYEDEFIEKRLSFTDNLIPYDSLHHYLDKLPPDKNIYIYSFCRSGRRSGITTEFLRSVGYVNAYNVKGGIIAWEEAGFEIKSGK